MKFYNPFKPHIIEVDNKFYIREYVLSFFVPTPVYIDNGYSFRGSPPLYSGLYKWMSQNQFSSFCTINDARAKLKSIPELKAVIKLGKQSKKVKVHL
jgi:hypothetical protein